MPINAVSYEEHEALVAKVEFLTELVNYMLALQPDWLTMAQAAKAMGCSKSTVHRLTKDKVLNPTWQGIRPFYKATELREYLESTRVSTKGANKRILSALLGKSVESSTSVY